MERKKHERNKRYGFLLILMLLNWAAVAAMVLFVDPNNIRDIIFVNSYLPMTILLSGAFFWTLSIVFMSARSALRWCLGIMLFVYLRIWGIGSIVNALLIFGVLGSIEIYRWNHGQAKNLVA